MNNLSNSIEDYTLAIPTFNKGESNSSFGITIDEVPRELESFKLLNDYSLNTKSRYDIEQKI